MAAKGDATSVALLGVAVALALQIPTALQAIGNPTVRSVAMVLALVVLLVCAALARPRDVATVIRNSMRPRGEDRHRITFRPPKLPKLTTLIEEVEPDTEDETPHPHRRK